MAAVVLDDEDAHQEASGEGRQGEHEPIGDVEAVDHQAPDQEIGYEGIDDLPDALGDGGFLVALDDLQPGWFGAFAGVLHELRFSSCGRDKSCE